jgi:hypothetical protein
MATTQAIVIAFDVEDHSLARNESHPSFAENYPPPAHNQIEAAKSMPNITACIPDEIGRHTRPFTRCDNKGPHAEPANDPPPPLLEVKL